MQLYRRAQRDPQLLHNVRDRCALNNDVNNMFNCAVVEFNRSRLEAANLQFSKLWRHFLWLLGLNACGSTLSIVAWVARYQQKVFSFASKEAKKGSAEYWSGQV